MPPARRPRPCAFARATPPFLCAASAPPRAARVCACAAEAPRARAAARRPYGYWTDAGHRAAELRAFAAARGEPARMPTDGELRAGGRADLAGALRRNGGWEAGAAAAGLVPTSLARPRSIYLGFCTPLRPGARLKPHRYWNEFGNLRRELAEFAGRAGRAGEGRRRQLPSTAELEAAQRHDLVRAIRKHGGPEAVARRLDLRFRYRSNGYWRKFENVEAELRLLLDAFDEPSEMPPLSALARHGPPGLKYAVAALHGGKHAVAARLGLSTGRKPVGYWCVRENRLAEVAAFVAHVRPHADAMPGKRLMVAHGRGDLAQALERHGDMRGVAEALGLKPPARRAAARGQTQGGRVSMCVCLKRSRA